MDAGEADELRQRLRVAEFDRDHYKMQRDSLAEKIGAANRRSEAKSRWDAAQLLRSVATHTMTKTDRAAWGRVVQWLWRDEWGTFAERFPGQG